MQLAKLVVNPKSTVLVLCFLACLKNILSQECDFKEETVPVKQPDGSFACKCDRTKGYIGPAEYACSFVECPKNMLPDDDATCQCIDDFFKRDGQCIQKSRCKVDETILHNGSRHDDRKCDKKDPENIRHQPLVVISDVKSTSVSLEVFRNVNMSGIQNVTFIFKDLNDDIQNRRVVKAKIDETDPKVSIIITGLSSNTSYRVEVVISDKAGMSNPAMFVLHTELQMVRSRAAPLVKVIEKDKASCTLQVTPDKEVHSGKIALTFRNLSDNTEGHIEKDIVTDTPVLMKVTGLIANTTYQIDITTDDVAGISESRQFQIQTDAELKPSKPHVEENSHLGIIVGVVIGAVVVFGLVIAAVVSILRKRRQQEPVAQNEDGRQQEPVAQNEDGRQQEPVAQNEDGLMLPIQERGQRGPAEPNEERLMLPIEETNPGSSADKPTATLLEPAPIEETAQKYTDDQ